MGGVAGTDQGHFCTFTSLVLDVRLLSGIVLSGFRANQMKKRATIGKGKREMHSFGDRQGTL